MSAPAPVRFHRHVGDIVGIDWADGHRSAFPSRWLRGHCPCAHCVDEWTGERKVGEADVPFNVAPVRLKSVGRYAVLIEWNDGHAAGLFSHQYLRELSAKYAEGPAVPESGEPACGSKGGCV